MPSLKDMTAKIKSKSTPLKKPTSGKLVFKSSEKVSESDLESETESETESGFDSGPPVARKPLTQIIKSIQSNGLKPKPASTSSNSGSEDEDEDETNGNEDDDDSSQSSSEGSESSDNSSSEDETSDGEGAGSTAQAGSIAGQSTNSISTNFAPRATVPDFIPPDGFKLLKSDGANDLTAAKFFNEQNLAGKQIWHITAPASIPIAAIKKVSMQDVQLGRPSVQHNGQDYGFVAEGMGEATLANLMLPLGNSYHPAPQTINKTLHLQQIVQRATSAVSVPAVKPIRQQPEGLRMRFFPIGSLIMPIDNKGKYANQDRHTTAVPSVLKRPATKPNRGSEEDTESESSGGEEQIVFIDHRTSKKPGRKSASSPGIESRGSSDTSFDTSSEDSSDEEDTTREPETVENVTPPPKTNGSLLMRTTPQAVPPPSSKNVNSPPKRSFSAMNCNDQFESFKSQGNSSQAKKSKISHANVAVGRPEFPLSHTSREDESDKHSALIETPNYRDSKMTPILPPPRSIASRSTLSPVVPASHSALSSDKKPVAISLNKPQKSSKTQLKSIDYHKEKQFGSESRTLPPRDELRKETNGVKTFKSSTKEKSTKNLLNGTPSRPLENDSSQTLQDSPHPRISPSETHGVEGSQHDSSKRKEKHTKPIHESNIRKSEHGSTSSIPPPRKMTAVPLPKKRKSIS